MAWEAEEIAVLRSLALSGEGEETVALTLKRTRADVRQMASLLGLDLTPLAKNEWCIRCASPRAWIDPQTGWCEPCTIKTRLEAQRIADDEEEERLREQCEREMNVTKKARERMRARYDANPRRNREERAL